MVVHLLRSTRGSKVCLGVDACVTRAGEGSVLVIFHSILDQGDVSIAKAGYVCTL